MRIQVLVAAINQNDRSLPEKMNITTDVIVGNQCDRNSVEHFELGGNSATYLNFNERGVGLNRNNALMRATGDILLFADYDMKYEDGYADTVKKAFSEIPDADAIFFNIKTVGADMNRRENETVKRIRFFNCLNYGAARIAVKRSSIIREGIYFNMNFGGGCPYSSGEDSLFITEMLKKGLKLYAYPETIAEVDQTTSTWFTGYNEKYFYDKGALFEAMSRRFAALLCLQDVLRHYKIYKPSGFSASKIRRLMKAGRKGFKNGSVYEK